MSKIFSVISGIVCFGIAILPVFAQKQKDQEDFASLKTARMDYSKSTLLHNCGCSCAQCQQAKDYAKDSIV